MIRARLLLCAAMLAALAACGVAPPTTPESTSSTEAPGSLVPRRTGEPAPWDQPVAGAVEATRWHAIGQADRPIDPGGGPWDDPAELMADTGRFFAAQTPAGEVTARLVDHDPATGSAVGHVRIIGVADDSVAAIDLRLELQRREPDGGWAIVRVEERLHCRRDVSGDVCV